MTGEEEIELNVSNSCFYFVLLFLVNPADEKFIQRIECILEPRGNKESNSDVVFEGEAK